MPTITRNVSQYVLTKHSHASKAKNSIATRADINPLVPARTQYVSQLVLTKPLQCWCGHKIYLYHTHHKPARTQNSSQHELTKQTHISDNTKFISNCVDQTPPMTVRTKREHQIHPMPARTLKVSQRV
jgi:hypothetical protein